ncbi:hypothetical protein PR202_ga06405 [Eleusine coracana subsp. coracana]|uniref:WDR11 first beta-propeller domain-containing protein n=1 Tax=Eleusine coracana subsp. coracana TaxID=191504 RepID=A0AAV5BUR5_ELECO|nr:hypothetical protein PR202_ga06405 [Eleusine coracana subsp. coracana]
MASSAAPARSHGNATAGSATAMMLPGPPGRGNGGCIDLSPAGLLAHGAGSSVVVSDPRSMQLLCVLPMPSSSLASFVTAVRWAPPACAIPRGRRGGGRGGRRRRPPPAPPRRGGPARPHRRLGRPRAGRAPLA